MASELRKAMKGWGTDEGALINIICSTSYEDMAQINKDYSEQFDRDLIKDIKKECSGNFEDVLVGLCTDRSEYDAALLRKAMKGIGTNESLLIEVLCTRSASEIEGIKEAYNKLYDKELSTAIEGETSGNFEKLLIKLLDCEEEKKDDDDVQEDVEKLYKAGEKKFGTDEGVFIRLFAGNTREYREKLYYAYAEKHGKALDAVVKSEFSGTLEKALVTLCTPCKKTFAKKFNAAMEGMGTNEERLIRYTVCMKERYLKETAEEYLEVYKKTLEKHIDSEISGDFKKAVLAVFDNFAKLGT